MREEGLTKDSFSFHSGCNSKICSPLEAERTEPTTVWPEAISWLMTCAATKPLAPVTSVLGILRLFRWQEWCRYVARRLVVYLLMRY